MKHLKYFVMSYGFLITSAASAQSEVARTTFWQVPSVKQVQLRVESLDSKINKVCSEYRELVGTNPEDDTFDSNDIQRMRTETPNMLDKVFTAKFRLSIPVGGSAWVDEANKEIDSLRAKDLLPFYSLKLGNFSTNFQPTTNVIVNWKTKSLSAVSSSVGLKPLTISVLPGNASSVVVIKGKDTVCDLLVGDVWLEYDAPSSMTPQANDFEQVSRYYADFSEEVSDVLVKKKTALGRASLLGYKMASFFIIKSIADARTEEILEYYIDNFFDAEMLPNHLWQTQDPDGVKLMVPQQVTSTVKVVLRR